MTTTKLKTYSYQRARARIVRYIATREQQGHLNAAQAEHYRSDPFAYLDMVPDHVMGFHTRTAFVDHTSNEIRAYGVTAASLVHTKEAQERVALATSEAAKLEQAAEACEALAQDTLSLDDDYVIENQGFYIAFDDAARQHVRCCGIQAATRLTRLEAHRLAVQVINGNDHRGRALRTHDAAVKEARANRELAAKLREVR